jgi:micrococcal nuclease
MEPFCYRATVVRVVDGDTIRLDIDLGFDIILNNQSVRLYRVDTPECRTRDLKEKAAGLLAKSVVKGFVDQGSKVVIKTSLDTKGKFGRILGTIITDEGVNINEHLIDNNYAVEYYGQSKDDVNSLHQENYNELVDRGELEAII